MNELDLLSERDRLFKALSESHNKLWKIGKEYAQAEHDYKKSNRVEIFKLHEQKQVAWTACPQLAQGEPDVAQLRLARDIKKVEYDIGQDKVQAIKLQLRIIESEIERSWGQAKNRT